MLIKMFSDKALSLKQSPTQYNLEYGAILQSSFSLFFCQWLKMKKVILDNKSLKETYLYMQLPLNIKEQKILYKSLTRLITFIAGWHLCNICEY